MSEKKEKSMPVKKGVVVDRKHNRTVPQNIALQDRKLRSGEWKDLGGIFQSKKNAGVFVRPEGRKLVPVTKKVAEYHMAQVAAREAEAKELLAAS